MKHYSSTSKNPQHDDCPKGKKSWCKFQIDAATGSSTYKPVKNPIPPAIQQIIEPIFSALDNEKFLESCKKILSSNNNESFHNLLWGLAPKEFYSSPEEVELAIFISVCLFNSGFTWTFSNVLKEYGIET